MLTKIVEDYKIVADIAVPPDYQFIGGSSSAKAILPEVFGDKPRAITVLDIGFGTGDLGTVLKKHPLSKQWKVDGIEGYYKTCCNVPLFETGAYRNVWHGMAQELGADLLSSYDLICLFDVIEHLDVDAARKLLRDLLSSMKHDAKLAIGTPLWFLQQGHVEAGDLEPHLCGIPVNAFLSLNPTHYCITQAYLVGTFVFDKSSLALIDKFQPTNDPAFNEAAGKAQVAQRKLVVDSKWHVLHRPAAANVTPPPARLTKIVENYKIVADIEAPPGYQFAGWSASAIPIIPEIFGDTPRNIAVLDIGFGVGNLGKTVKAHHLSKQWQVDGIDGFYNTCCNVPLFESGIYRNVWHGLVQDLDRDRLASYDLICFFDVIEHLDAALAKRVLTDLLTWMKDDCKLAIGTPLWFLLQGHGEEGDLEPHLCGVPVTSLLDLKPSMYSISDAYLVGTFVLEKSSLAHIDKFVPTADRGFNQAAGTALVEQHQLVIDRKWHTLAELVTEQ